MAKERKRKAKHKPTRRQDQQQHVVRDESPAKPPASAAEPFVVRHRRTIIPLAILAVVAFLLVSNFFGLRPAGGDISLVHLPRMSFYHRALGQGRLPLWNEEADFGTPLLAEGQIGVLYPPHLLLYGLLETSSAYTASMLLHFVLAGWFAYLCGRGFQLSRPAAGLAAIVFVGQGFFVVHLTQPWSYTTGCWLPLAILAAWRWLDAGSWRWLIGLVAIPAVQLLGGHFQLAFYTQMVVVLLAVAAPIIMRGRRLVVLRRGLLLPVALAGALAMAAVQLVPTAELALWGDSRGQGFDYLASFTTHPLHLVNYLAPTLFHRDPLWEPIAWDPWRGSVTECLTYVGIVPFGLAMWIVVDCWRNHEDEDAKLWCLLLVASIALCIGPFLPGFRALIQLPGFGWFSATARWSIVSGLFLGLLAGRGLDRFNPSKMPRWCRRYVVGAAVALAILVVVVVLTVRGAERFDKPPDRLGGVNLGPKLIRHGYPRDSLPSITPANQMGWMLFEELIYPVAGFGVLLLVSFTHTIAGSRRQFIRAALILTVADLVIVAVQLNRLEFVANRRLVEQSAVLRAIADRDPHRVAGPTGRLPMAISTRALGNPTIPDMSLYWVKDNRVSANAWAESLPTVPGLPRWGDIGARLGRSSIPPDEDDLELLRLTHIQLLVLGPGAGEPHPDSSMRKVGEFSDPWLLEQIVGKGILEMHSNADFSWTIWAFQTDMQTARAWAFPVGTPAEPGSDPRLARRPPPARRRMLDRARAASRIMDEGERVVVSGTADAPSVLVLTDLNYPGWEAVLSQGDASRRVPIESAFGNWRAVRIPDAGEYTVNFTFRPASFRLGCQISMGALVLWLSCCLMTLRWRRFIQGGIA